MSAKPFASARGEAGKLGFQLGDDAAATYRVGDDGLVESRAGARRHQLPPSAPGEGWSSSIPRVWNAIGAEPELTLSLLPNAHAVLFILAADTGVTQSDLAIWTDHIGEGGADRRGRMVVLNKIDGLWDETEES